MSALFAAMSVAVRAIDDESGRDAARPASDGGYLERTDVHNGLTVLLAPPTVVNPDMQTAAPIGLNRATSLLHSGRIGRRGGDCRAAPRSRRRPHRIRAECALPGRRRHPLREQSYSVTPTRRTSSVPEAERQRWCDALQRPPTADLPRAACGACAAGKRSPSPPPAQHRGAAGTVRPLRTTSLSSRCGSKKTPHRAPCGRAALVPTFRQERCATMPSRKRCDGISAAPMPSAPRCRLLRLAPCVRSRPRRSATDVSAGGVPYGSSAVAVSKGRDAHRAPWARGHGRMAGGPCADRRTHASASRRCRRRSCADAVRLPMPRPACRGGSGACDGIVDGKESSMACDARRMRRGASWMAWAGNAPKRSAPRGAGASSIRGRRMHLIRITMERMHGIATHRRL